MCLRVTTVFMVVEGVKIICINVVLKRMLTNYAFTAVYFLVVIDSVNIYAALPARAHDFRL